MSKLISTTIFKTVSVIVLTFVILGLASTPSPLASAKSYKNRSQFKNSHSKNYTKRNTTNGRFLDQKTSSPTKFKNVKTNQL